MRLGKKFFIACILGLWSAAAYAGTVNLRGDVPEDTPRIDVIRHDAERIEFEVRIPVVNVLQSTLDGKVWDRVEIPGGGSGYEIGAPEIPHFSRLIAIPATSAVQAEFKTLETTILPDIELIPAQEVDPEDLAQNPRIDQYDQEVYSTDAFYPSIDVITGDPSLLRGLRVIPVRMHPVQYNPVTKEMRIIHRFCITVRFEGTDLRNASSRPMRPVSRSWARLMRPLILNYDELGLDEVPVGSYLIVCENDANLVNNLLSPLIDWKTRKGHVVEVETFSPGSSNSTIKSIIQNAYNTWEIPPEFVLLVGDTNGNYTLPGWSPSGIDHPYSQLDGTDILADVAIGRLPVENATEVMAQTNKVLWYEKMPYIANMSWYHQGCLVAGSSYSGISTIQTNRWIKTRMIWNEYTRIDTFWYNMGTSSVNTTIVNAINAGVSFVNYRGWIGMENFSLSSIEGLVNGYMLPFVTTLTCGTGGFDGSTESFMEHFVTVGTPSLPKAAVGCIGTATSSTHTRFNNTVDYGIYAGIFDEGLTQAGNALNRGKLELYNAYQIVEPSQVVNYSKWNALAGDPGLELFTGAIRFMECSVPSTITWGENTLSLTVNQSGVGPLEDALVCLYKSGELHEVGTTDINGQVTLPLNVSSTGNVKVTVTKHNFYPIVDSLDVVQSNVAVGYYDHSIDDDANGSSNGDGDGTINPGETVEIPMVAKNYGSTTTATGISMTASLSDGFATLGDAYETFPNLSPGATGTSADDFDLTIASDCPHGHVVHLDLLTQTDQGSWDGQLDLEVVSYDMLTTSAVAVGSDTLLSPGETSDFILTVQNDGGKTATSLAATLTSLNPYVTVNDDYAEFGTVGIGASATCTSNPFNLSANIGTPNGQMADLEVTFTDEWGAIQTDTITIVLGTKTSLDPQGPDEYGYYCFDNTDVAYPQAPVYAWVEIDPAYGGNGTQLNINDPGENQDASLNVGLPFTFRYYGEDVNMITVCSNGWISMWPNNSFTDFRNYPIPSSVGPNGLVAAFWDDLITWSGGHVFMRYDISNHRFIIEWSRLKVLHSPQPQEVFEIILLDPVYYPTPTGDGEIIFQYHTVVEVQGPTSYGGDNTYSTVGIERPDKQDGIEVVYSNIYGDPATAHLENGRAYLFTTNFELSGDPPVIGVSPSSLTINVPEGGTGSEQLTISNTGGLYLIYSTTVTLSDQLSGIISGSPARLDGSGGPDNYGYTWIDSDEPGGPDYNWIDISGIGTQLSFEHNDSTTAEIPIGFNFPFYGEMRDEFIASANGWISFSSHNGAWSNISIPNPEAPLDLISPFWDDLDPLQPGASVRYWTNNEDSLVVSFLEVPHWGSSITGTYTFQMILTADGHITFQYQTLTGNYQSCTVGIQNGTGTDGLLVAFNQAYLHDNLAIHFYHPFLQVDPASGVVAPDYSNDVNVTAYGYGMEPGLYEATLGIDCNDPETPHVDVPITINIGGVAPPPIEVTMVPDDPPITIPAGGGNFGYTAGLENVSGMTQQVDFWIMADLPNGTPYGPILLRTGLTLGSGVSLTRDLSQTVPGGAPAGEYYYYGNAGYYPDSVMATAGFNFTKEAGAGDGQGLDGWDIYGWDEENTPEIPDEFAFKGCHPNPFNPVTEVLFALPQSASVQVRIFDVLGRQVASLQDGMMEAGNHALRWDARNLASGVYFLNFQSGKFIATEKLLLLK